MKFYLLCILFFISLTIVQAQRIRVNGDVKTHTEIPIQGVLVMAFDDRTMLRSFVSDDKGEYSFNVDRMTFDILFYKPGLKAHTYSLNNRLDKETQGLYIYIQMDDSTAETAISLPLWLRQHHLTANYMDSVYNEEIRKQPAPSAKKINRKQLLRNAIAEQKRFSNYQKNTVKQSIDNQESEVTTITIGPDTYELITSEKKDKRYYKNLKPVTESTYRFETTRRYDGVLKNTRNVKHFDKYKPLQHVKS
jgi:hypothetical protein